MLEVIECNDVNRVRLSVTLTASEAAVMYGALASRVMRYEDVLYRGATTRNDWTREELEAAIKSGKRVMDKLNDICNLLDK